MKRIKVINREDLVDEYDIEIVKTETHHDHVIIEGSDGKPWWKPNEKVVAIMNVSEDLYKIAQVLLHMGYNKNSEAYRKLYRDCGYSLSGYWEIFYDPTNNRLAHKYQPPKK